MKVVVYDGKHKIADRWEDHLYVVISQPITDIPVYKASREDVQEMFHNLDSEYHPEVSSVDRTESEEDHSVEETETESLRDPGNRFCRRVHSPKDNTKLSQAKVDRRQKIIKCLSKYSLRNGFREPIICKHLLLRKYLIKLTKIPLKHS